MTSHVSLVEVTGSESADSDAHLSNLNHYLTQKEDDNRQRWAKNVPT